jgi:hypothetical protein
VIHQDTEVFVPTYSGELHDINLPSKACQSVRPGIVEMKIMDEERIARLAKECIEAGAGYSPGETVYEWFEKAKGVLGERHVSWASCNVFRLVRDACNPPFPVNPRGSEGEDFAGSHAGAQADEEGERYFCTFRRGFLAGAEAEMSKEVFDLERRNPAYSWRVVPGRTEPTKRAVAAPLPLIPSDGEDVAEKVHVALYGAPSDRFQPLVSPGGHVSTDYVIDRATGKIVEVAQKGVDPLPLEVTPALPDADLVPVPHKSFSERLTGYRPTLHGQNLGLSRSGPETRSGFGLEGARLANSVPLDL